MKGESTMLSTIGYEGQGCNSDGNQCLLYMLYVKNVHPLLIFKRIHPMSGCGLVFRERGALSSSLTKMRLGMHLHNPLSPFVEGYMFAILIKNTEMFSDKFVCK